MNKFATGLLTGGVLVAAGVSYVMNDKSMKRKVTKSSRKVKAKAEDMLDDINDML